MGPRVAALVLMVTTYAAAADVPAPSDRTPPTGWIGVALGEAPSPPDGATERAARGVRIVGVVEESPAERADLREGDIVVGVDGLALSAPADLVARVRELPPGTWVTLSVDRKGSPRQIELKVGARPTEDGSFRVRVGWIGVRAIDIPPPLRVRFGAPDDRGVMIWEVRPGSPAGSAGIEVGDVVYEIAGEPVTSPGELREITSRAGVGNTVEISVARDGNRMTLEALVEKLPSD